MSADSADLSPATASLEAFGLSSANTSSTGILVRGAARLYTTRRGAAFLGDALDLLPRIPDGLINLVLASPPYALVRKKPYGNESAQTYVRWFLPFAKESDRVLTADGSLVLDIGGTWTEGLPVKSTHQFELLLALTKTFHLA